jgi:CheY-like chemotaxis protein
MAERKKSPRILIVEDDSTTSYQLTQLLSAQIPQLEIQSASTQHEAMSQIQTAIEFNCPFDIVLLDFLLPKDRGDSPEVNESVFRTLRKSLQDSVVIHTSGYVDDPDLMKFILREAMGSPFGPRSVFLSKLDKSWSRDLVKIVEQVISSHSGEAFHGRSNFLSCFISYSHGDEEFVKLLYTRLRSQGIEVWFAPENMKPGRKLKEEIDTAVRVYDKLLVVLSDLSIRSDWVSTEIRTAIDEERKTGVRKLFPIRLVDYDLIKTWESFNSDLGKDMAAELRQYYIPDFSNWRDADGFEVAFAKLLEGMEA